MLGLLANRRPSSKPVLTAHLQTMVDVETLYPVLARLHQRGRISVKVLIHYKRLLLLSRLRKAFGQYGFWPKAAAQLRMNLLSWFDIISSDAVLTKADPKRDVRPPRWRWRFITANKIPTIFVQHGAVQNHVNAREFSEPVSHYATKLLLWEPVGASRELLSSDVPERITVVGFIKKNILPRRIWGKFVTDWAARYSKRLLVCQSFVWKGDRFSDDDVDAFYEMIDALAKRNPNLGIILRPHRGSNVKNLLGRDQELLRQHPNIIYSGKYRGPIGGATIHDVLDLCDAMIAPASTVVLDCIYHGKPAAVFRERTNFFPELRQIIDVESIEAFLAEIEFGNPEMAQIKARFGDIDENLDRAAIAIEETLFEICS